MTKDSATVRSIRQQERDRVADWIRRNAGMKGGIVHLPVIRMHKGLAVYASVDDVAKMIETGKMLDAERRFRVKLVKESAGTAYAENVTAYAVSHGFNFNWWTKPDPMSEPEARDLLRRARAWARAEGSGWTAKLVSKAKGKKL